VARVLAVAPDLMFASRIEATLGAAGHDVQLATAIAEASELEDADLMVVDLDREPAEGVVGLGVPVLGFYAHLNTETREAAEAAGVDLVVPRSRMAREMPVLVERLLA
jgi:DNA-binding response OmpR family regulator